MSPTNPADETLMAYADGELSGPEADSVAELAARDPAVAQRIALFRASGRIVQAVFNPVLDEEVPPQLRAAVLALGSGELESAPARAPAWLAGLWLGRWAKPVPAWGAALAAACCLILGLQISGFLHEVREPPPDLATTLAGLPSPVLDAFERLPSGQAVAARLGTHAVRLLALGTYGDDANVCREVAVTSSTPNAPASLHAVACRTANHWSLRAMAATAVEPGGLDDFRPAAAGQDLASSLGLGTPWPQADEMRLMQGNR